MRVPGGSIAPLPRGLLPLLIGVVVAVELFTAIKGIRELVTSQADAILGQAGAAYWHTLMATVLAAAVAVQIRRSSLTSLVLIQRRERATVALIGLRIGAVIVVVHVIATVLVVVYARSLGLEGMPPLFVLLQSAALITASSVLGAALGWWIENFLAIPAALVVNYALLLPVVHVPALEYAPQFVAPQDVLVVSWFILAALAWVLGAVVVLGLTGGSRRVSGYAVALLAVVGLLVADGFLRPEGWRARNRAPVACVGERPRVCAYPERRAWLKDTRDVLVRMDRRLLDFAPDRTAVREWTEKWRGSNKRNRERGREQLQVADPRQLTLLSQSVAGTVSRCENPIADYDALPTLLELQVSGKSAADVRDYLGRPTDMKELEAGARRSVKRCPKSG